MSLEGQIRAVLNNEIKTCLIIACAAPGIESARMVIELFMWKPHRLRKGVRHLHSVQIARVSFLRVLGKYASMRVVTPLCEANKIFQREKLIQTIGRRAKEKKIDVTKHPQNHLPSES